MKNENLIYQAETAIYLLSTNLEKFKRDEISPNEFSRRLKNFSKILWKISEEAR